MNATPSSSHQGSPIPDLNHSVGKVLCERAGIPENAPRIKIGDQYYHVVRVIGGHYEAPISNPKELKKAARIGEVYFSAHKKFAENRTDLKGKKIEYANEQGIVYEGGKLVQNNEVVVDPEDSMSYLKATDNFEWQEKVVDFEQKLDRLNPNDNFPRPIPHYLDRIAKRTGNNGPYTVQQVKRFVLEYTRDRLLAAHEVYVQGHPDPEGHRKDIKRSIDAQIDTMESATEVINYRNDYFKAGHLKANHVWHMMVRMMQPQEFRLLPVEEAFNHQLDETSPDTGSETTTNPRGRRQHQRAQSVDLSLLSRSGFLSLSPHEPRASSATPAGHFRPIKPDEHTDEQDSLSNTPASPNSPLTLKPTPIRSPSSTATSSLLEDLDEQQNMSPSPSNLRKDPFSPSVGSPPHLPITQPGQSGIEHHHTSAFEVVNFVDTHPPAESHIPTTDSSTIETWVDIPLTPLPSRRSSVALPFEDQNASQKLDRKSPLPRRIQQSSLRIAPSKPEFYEEDDYRARAALFPQLKLITDNVSAHDWEDRAATKEACRTAHVNMERNANPAEYTIPERYAIKQVIQKKESAGGFGLLMAGTRYELVAKGLRYSARTGRF